MCLILFSFQQHPDHPLILAANRDEFYARPTRSAQFWPDFPDVLAGQDLEQGGTWLGITRTGRFAAVTNIRNPQATEDAPASRGELTRDFLLGEEAPLDYLEKLQHQRDHYKPFNLLVGDHHSLCYLSSYSDAPRRLEPGLYGLSNGELDSVWPKINHGKAQLAEAITDTPDHELILSLMRDDSQAPDNELPDTGVGMELERVLSPRFIASEQYGTRASTVLIQNQSGGTFLIEQNYTEGGELAERNEFVFDTAVF